MSGTCQCGHVLDHGFDALGCLGCGQPCCPNCSYAPEAAVYCAICTAAFFGLSVPGAGIGIKGRDVPPAPLAGRAGVRVSYPSRSPGLRSGSLGPAAGAHEGRREPVGPEGVASGPKT